MSDVKQVKVDNWGIYFLQRLKHFFNRTDYCDLTLQFQDNAQLKVHRLVLSACTEYFELLERTCEMYEDCLVMPDDLQADVVVPIVNFMYTGQLEFKMDMLEKLYQTSLVMNMPVLSKLLDAHRSRSMAKSLTQSYSNSSQKRNNRMDSVKQSRHTPSPSARMSSMSNKRSYSNAFQNASSSTPKAKSVPVQVTRAKSPVSKSPLRAPSPLEIIQNNKKMLGEPRPTRYELPEELDTDNIFENSFSNISYTSAPLMVHPDSTKHYRSKKDSLFHKKLMKTSTMEIVECKKIKSDNIFQDDIAENTTNDEPDMFQTSFSGESHKDSNQLFDQIMDSNETSKVVIETKGGKQASNIDHAKIISEVLKKYPHLVKSNKNIKLKILNSPTPSKAKKPRVSNFIEEKEVKPKTEPPDYTYETDVLDSKEAAKLIAMGAENIKGPWICLICGTPGRALHFTSYYKFRRHLVEVHNEKCVPTICEYCGFRSYKRNYMVHHCYTQHGVKPPPQYNFPKCNQCNYVAITEGFLVKHKLTQHGMGHKIYRCNVCSASFGNSNQLLAHIQKTGHKFSPERKVNLQCIYCLKVFNREANLYAHLKTNHKFASKRDGIIDDSDEEKEVEKPNVKREALYDNESEDNDVQYQIHQRADGVHQVHVVSKKPNASSTTTTFNNQKILNPGFSKPTMKQQPQKTKSVRTAPTVHNEFMQDEVLPPENNAMNDENIIFIDDVEYVMKNNELIPRKKQKEFIVPESMETDNQSIETITPSTSMQFADLQDTENLQQAKMLIKKTNMNQPIQIVVSNEEEYKALMSSNHSIIFDDGDANKTLTMMTAPHNATLETAGIDLDNTQSNDMMIIQDDYPLSVSEAVATDNNIVVVYSHPVGQVNDDPNKQYQIITSQDIGAQFIQSSAMITQNYETVTTSTPVMSANVIEAQVHESWQNNSQQNIENQQMHIASDGQLQSLTEIKEVSEIELPEVEITALPKEIPAEIPASDNDPSQSIMSVQEVDQNNTDQVNSENATPVENIPVIAMDTGVPSSIMSDKETDNGQSMDSSDQTDIIPISENNEPEESNNPESIVTQEENDKIDETVDQLIETQNELNDNLNKNISEEQETMQANDNSNVAEEYVADGNTSNIEPAVIKVAKVQIQNLTSEWSDDEYEAAEESTKETPKSEKGTHETEESIENIQQEVDKQMCAAPGDESLDSTLNDSTSSEFKDPEASTAPEAGQPPVAEKLSSLLNDWEDNDSQEENSINEHESENVNAEVETANEINESELVNAETIDARDENGEIIENQAENTVSMPSDANVENMQEIENAEIDKLDPKNDDKIKSLVSDWDDDEEENKE